MNNATTRTETKKLTDAERQKLIKDAGLEGAL